MKTCAGTEAQIVLENNEGCSCECCKPKPAEPVDPIKVYNIRGTLVGYSWNAADDATLNFTLSGDLENKTVEIAFINMRGETCYTFSLPAEEKISLKIKADTINKNTYTCVLTLIGEEKNSILKPYVIYVK